MIILFHAHSIDGNVAVTVINMYFFENISCFVNIFVKKNIYKHMKFTITVVVESVEEILDAQFHVVFMKLIKTLINDISDDP